MRNATCFLGNKASIFNMVTISKAVKTANNMGKM